MRKKIFAICGCASTDSANLKLIESVAVLAKDDFEITLCDNLKKLPHFDPESSSNNPPQEIIAFWKSIAEADGVLISTPEYIYSIPSGLKNAIEWCVSTTLFDNKPLAIITASAHGQKGHEELQLIMYTVMAKFTSETCLLIQGIKGKINNEGELTDSTAESVENLIKAFKLLVN